MLMKTMKVHLTLMLQDIILELLVLLGFVNPPDIIYLESAVPVTKWVIHFKNFSLKLEAVALLKPLWIL